LVSYVTIVQHAKGLDDLLMKVIDRPSLWSILRQAGVHADIMLQPERIGPAQGNTWKLPSSDPVYDFPMNLTINQHPALDFKLVVTAPRPPLLACGGIIGMIAEKPGDRNTLLTFRIISAHCAATAQ
jgi:hypothetical protein